MKKSTTIAAILAVFAALWMGLGIMNAGAGVLCGLATFVLVALIAWALNIDGDKLEVRTIGVSEEPSPYGAAGPDEYTHTMIPVESDTKFVSVTTKGDGLHSFLKHEDWIISDKNLVSTSTPAINMKVPPGASEEELRTVRKRYELPRTPKPGDVIRIDGIYNDVITPGEVHEVEPWDGIHHDAEEFDGVPLIHLDMDHVKGAPVEAGDVDEDLANPQQL